MTTPWNSLGLTPIFPRATRIAWLAMLLLGSPGLGEETHTMHFPQQQWATVPPAEEGLNDERLAAAVEYLKANSGRDGVKELVIVRTGRVVWQGADASRAHGVWSCTKSFTSTALGLLVDDGKCRLDTRIADVLPALAELYPQATLAHFTTMTSGYRAEGDDQPKAGYLHGPSSTPFVPTQPLFPPGEAFAYWDSAMNVLGLALTEIAGEPLEELVKRRIMDPIGADPEQWSWGERLPAGGRREPGQRKINSGSGNAGGHVRISALELARFGHLYLNEGQWAGRTLLSPEWVRQATTVQVAADAREGFPASNIPGAGQYGFNWWVNGVNANGERKWPGAPESTFAAVGYNNNFCLVIPPWRMVVVRLGLDQDSRKIEDAAVGEFLRQLGEAIEN